MSLERKKEIMEARNRDAVDNSLPTVADGDSLQVRNRFTLMSESSNRIRVAIDMSFDDLMDEKTMRKCIRQLNYCYAANRRSVAPVQLYITSLSTKSKEVLWVAAIFLHVFTLSFIFDTRWRFIICFCRQWRICSIVLVGTFT